MAADAADGPPEAIETRLAAIREARSRLLAEMEGVTEEQGRWRPKGGEWSLPYWTAQLRSCEPLLDGLAHHLQDLPLTEVIHPHFLSGPLDALQRLEFIRFHLEHHLPQVRRLREAQGI
jgi:hypothetical protein